MKRNEKKNKEAKTNDGTLDETRGRKNQRKGRKTN